MLTKQASGGGDEREWTPEKEKGIRVFLFELVVAVSPAAATSERERRWLDVWNRNRIIVLLLKLKD